MNQLESMPNLILIVEDEKLNYQLLKLLLDKNNFLHIWAKNGEEAVDICKSNNEIGLIIMDIKMPVMDGLVATKKIKALKPALKILAHTAFAMDFDYIEALEAGCDDYITKPAKNELLLSKIRQYL